MFDWFSKRTENYKENYNSQEKIIEPNYKIEEMHGYIFCYSWFRMLHLQQTVLNQPFVYEITEKKQDHACIVFARNWNSSCMQKIRVW